MRLSAYSTPSLRRFNRVAGIAAAVAVVLLVSALPCRADPTIASVSTIDTNQTQTIDIYGTGFCGGVAANCPAPNGVTFPVNSPSGGLSDYIVFEDYPAGTTFTVNGSGDIVASNGPWGAGYGGDIVDLDIESWTDTEIQLGGFTGAYGCCGTLNAGDQALFEVGSYSSGPLPDPGTAIIAAQSNISTVVAPVPEPSSIVLMLSGLLALAFVALRKRFGVAFAGTR
jgi:hypothetical protein